MAEAVVSSLFTGNPAPLGGLSNEAELSNSCPQEFRNPNPWSEYASRLFFSGANISNWKWKSQDVAIQKRQMACFRSLLGSFTIKHQHKEAVAGWMLSEMLVEAPEYIAK